MSSMKRKILRNMVRCSAQKNGMKPSKAVHEWRYILFKAKKRMEKDNDEKS